MIDTNIESLAIKRKLSRDLEKRWRIVYQRMIRNLFQKHLTMHQADSDFQEKADRKNRQGMLYSLGIKGVMNP